MKDLKNIFLQKANKKFPNKFDYSKVNYRNAHTKIEIFCKECNQYFKITPGSFLLSKYGCNICSRKHQNDWKQKSVGELKNIFIKVHGDKYNYDKFIFYKNIEKDKIKIYCKACKEYFLQNIKNHKNGCGCEKCDDRKKALEQTLTEEEIRNRLKQKYNDKITFEKYVYVEKVRNSKVTALCKKHGEFNTTLQSLLYDSKYGCIKCAREEITKGSVGRHLSQEQKDHLRKINTGKKLTEEFKQLQREIQLKKIKEVYGGFTPFNEKSIPYFEELNKKYNLQGVFGKNEYKVIGYSLDFYSSKYNIAIEWDEEYHFKTQEQIEKDIFRQNRIVKKLNCNFLRIRQKDFFDKNNNFNYINNIENKIQNIIYSDFT